MSKDTELDMKEVELNKVDPEKQLMTGGANGNGDAGSPLTEKNSNVKVKTADEKEEKFTGLTKEELLQVAGTPGWVKARWVLLILFCLGWFGMLAGVIVIIVQAPRCKPLSEMKLCNSVSCGWLLYQIGDVNSFTESGLGGLKTKISSLSQLKVKSLIVGPIHVSNANKLEDLNLTEISPDIGTLEQLEELIEAARQIDISVVLDMTPNYKGSDPWFSSVLVQEVADKLLDAAVFWLDKGVGGILLHDVETVSTKAILVWSSIKETIKNRSKVLIGVTKECSPEKVSRLFSITGVDLLLSGVLKSLSAEEITKAVDTLSSGRNQTQLAWNIGDRVKGHLASIVGPLRVKLSQLLLATLPGTPVFNYGDEIGLVDEGSSVNPKMVWNLADKAENESDEAESQRDYLSFFKTVSDLREKERSLLYGDYLPLYSSSSALAYLRKWDQSTRFVIALNTSPSDTTISLKLDSMDLPAEAIVVVSTDTKLTPGNSVKLAEIKLGPQQGVMLRFPYTQ